MSTLTPPSPGSKKSAVGTRANKEYRVLVKAIKAAGGEVRKPTGTGHPKVYFRGQFVTTLCLTPSDRRARKNELAQLRRAGMNI